MTLRTVPESKLLSRSRGASISTGPIRQHRLRRGAVSGIVAVAVLHTVLRVAEMLVHLDLQAGLKHLLRESGQQSPARRDRPVSAYPLHQRLSQRPIRLRLVIAR